MKSMLVFFFIALAIGASDQSEVSLSDIDVVLGEKWRGNLVYLDYGSNKEVAIPVEISIKKVKSGVYSFQYEYPEEPKANSKSKISVDLAKKKIGKESIERVERKVDRIVLTTVSSGKDNGKPAKFISTYTFGQEVFNLRKDVQFENQEPFMRNEYRMTR